MLSSMLFLPLILALTPPTDISPLLAPIAHEHNVPALAAVLIQGDTILYEGVTGTRARGQDQPAALHDQWHIGSCTKAITATLIARHVDRNTLAWDTTLFTTFPALADQADPGWRTATLKHFVTNSSGAPGDLSKDGLWARLWLTNETPAQARRLLIQGVTKEPPRFEPGTSYEYANAGFAIAGAMLERTAGRPYEQLLQTDLFNALDIISAGTGAPGVPGNMSQPRGHNAQGQPVEPTKEADNPAAIAPAGCYHMSIRDWSRFIALHLRAHAKNPHRSTTLLDPETFDLLHTPVHHNYAAGWLVATRPWAKGTRENDTGLVLNHAGSNTMWMAVTWIAPERDFAVLVCCNQGGPAGTAATDAAASALIQKYTTSQPNTQPNYPDKTP
jgi:CubicO group peptidase (beta-lactamase class C family)